MLARPSGGLVYHWRALRHGHKWRPFREQIADWLQNWPPRSKQLLLIGPSAGYTLPTEWLAKFEQVVAYDLDPLAPALFRWQHAKVPIRFEKQDMFWHQGNLSLRSLQKALRDHPDAAMLFSNVLGQVLLEGQASESQWYSFLKDLRRQLQGREWASYHDLFSTKDGEIIDHMTQGAWSDGLDKREFSWQLTAASQHQIQGLKAP